MKPDITLCSKACKTCGFPKSGTTNTLYADMNDLMEIGGVFPCHEYLQSKTGCENLGTETLDEIKVCRGYVAYIFEYGPPHLRFNPALARLFIQLKISDLQQGRDPMELKKAHRALQTDTKLGN